MENSGGRTLPDGFFDNLTEKQQAMLKVLATTDGEWIRGVDIRAKMREEYRLKVAHHPGGVSGLLSGFTRRYSKRFRRDLIPGRWVEDDNNHAEFRLGQKYADEVRAGLL